MLELLEKTLKEKITFENFFNFQAFLSFFSVDPKKIMEILNIKEGKEDIQIILNNILALTTKMNVISDKGCEDSIKKIKDISLRKSLFQIYHKITNNKIFLITLINDLLIYLPFGYFIGNHFIDTRGRLYMNGFALNIQNYPLARSVLKAFCDTNEDSLKNNWDVIK